MTAEKNDEKDLKKEEKARQERKHPEKGKERKKFEEPKEIYAESLVRLLGTDIPGEKNIYTGLTRIKGISWAFSNAICNTLKINKNKKVKDLSQKEIDEIVELTKKPNFPLWMLNRRKDLETGENKHLITTDLELQREFDIRRMKNMKSYKGWRHALGQPVRGQRTRSHFRSGRSVGVQKSKVKAAPAAEGKEKRGKGREKK